MSAPEVSRLFFQPQLFFAYLAYFVVNTILLLSFSACSPVSAPEKNSAVPSLRSSDLAPSALAISPDGRTLYVACSGANQALAFDLAQRQILRRYALPAPPSGLALSSDGARLVVTCAEPVSRVCVLETGSGKMLLTLKAGHTALGPVLSRDGQTLFVCDRFNDAVSVFDLSRAVEMARIPVAREPVSADLTGDGKFLLVANHFPAGRSDVPYVAATVSVIDLAQRKVVQELHLPNGSINLRQISVSPDGRYAALALTVARFQLPVTQLARGWVNVSAVTLLDLPSMQVLNTVPLDEPLRGAANPWAIAWSPDSRWLCVTHAGTHEVSVIDFPQLLKKLAALPAQPPAASNPGGDNATRCAADVPNDLSFLDGLRRRIKLAGNGPRAMAWWPGTKGTRADAFLVANYFSDSLDLVNLSCAAPRVESFELNPGRVLSLLRKGEMYFNDATLGFQGWQSCASCHDDDARIDAVNWDLLNDGIGNPKDTKSLVLSHQTPPVMSLGVRATAEIAVRSGIQNSLATALPEEIPAAMDEWIKSLKPAPSPFLVNGRLSEAALRGEKIFKSPEAGCSTCHEPELFTDLHSYSVGTQNPFDHGAAEFDTPTLHELWRTAPYLHDGSAATLREVVTTRNPKDEHGKTSHLTPGQVDDLVEYLRSL